jgi:hypothetical protein
VDVPLHGCGVLSERYHALLALILEELNITTIFLTGDALHHDEFTLCRVLVLIIFHYLLHLSHSFFFAFLHYI